MAGGGGWGGGGGEGKVSVWENTGLSNSLQKVL